MEPVAAVEFMLWGIKSEALAIIAATFLGPIAAVLVTRWRDATAGKRERRLGIFRTLMATRRQNINFEHVTALNLIEVEFYGVKSIETAWENYIKHLNSGPVDRQMSNIERETWDNTRADLLARLLAAMAKFLRYKMGEIDLRNGGYAPKGWWYRDTRASQVQDFVLDLAEGKKMVPVGVLDYTQPRQPAAPTGE